MADGQTQDQAQGQDAANYQIPVSDAQGSRWLIPPEDVDNALGQGYKLLSHQLMYDSKGERSLVFNEDVPNAIKQGFNSTPPTKMEKETTQKPFPQWLESSLEAGQKYAVAPFERMAEAGKKFGEEAGEAYARHPAPMTAAPVNEPLPEAEPTPEVLGAARGVGGFVGGTTADPRNLPFFLESGLPSLAKRLMSAGFAANMGWGAIQQSKHLRDIWGSASPEERAQAATELGLNLAATAAAARHAAVGEGPKRSTQYNQPDPATLREERGPESPALPSQVKTEPEITFVPGEEGEGQTAVEHFQKLPHEAQGEVPDELIGVQPRSPEDRVQSSTQQTAFEQKTGIPESLEPAARETQQPRSDFSEVDRRNLPGKPIDPRQLTIDWDSHPFMMEDDVEKAKKRVQEGQELNAIVKTDPTTGKMEVVDGHGSAQAALELGVPIRVTEAAGLEGAEAIGARVASHYAAGDVQKIKDVTANTTDDEQKRVQGQNVPLLDMQENALKGRTPSQIRPLTPGTDFPAERLREGWPSRPLEGVPGTDVPVENLTQRPTRLDLMTKINDAAAAVPNLHAKNGGSTFNLLRGDLNGQDMYSVSSHKNRERTLDHSPTPQEVRSYAMRNINLLKDGKASIGSWDAGDGRHVLDVVDTVKDREQAMKIAREHEQEAIYHLGGQGEIPVTGPARQKIFSKTPSWEYRPETSSYFAGRSSSVEHIGEPRALSPSEEISEPKGSLDFSPNQMNMNPIPQLLRLPGQLWKNLLGKLSDVSPTARGILEGKYSNVRKIDPNMAKLLNARDNIPIASRIEASSNLQQILQGADRDKERLAFLLADADSRSNLRINHPQEYQQAMSDPVVQGIVRRYRQYEQELTAQRASIGASVLPGDYVRRVYDRHFAESASTPFNKAAMLRDLPNKSREADPEYHYENGTHEFGPAYGPKKVSQDILLADRAIVQQMARQGQLIQKGQPLPRSIQYNGKTYYSLDQAKVVGSKDIYGVYDPMKFVKFKVANNVILAPREIVDAAARAGEGKEYKAGSLKQLYQKGVIAAGFGIPHAFANIPRRIFNSYEGAMLNPNAWKSNFRVVFDSALKRRAEAGPQDPLLRSLIRTGAARMDEGDYTGLGAGWLGLAKGHELIFKPGTWGGMGGVDIRARMDYAERLMREHPNWKMDQVGEEVEGKFGQYTRANWTPQQQKLAGAVMFPGWLFSSIKTGLEHPFRNTLSAAAIVYAMNQALHKSGMNRDEDRNDPFHVHVGNYSFSPTVFSEPFSKALAMPVEQGIQTLMRGGSGRQAVDTFISKARTQPGALSYHLLPTLRLPIELVTNRQFMGSEREIWKPGATISQRLIALGRHVASDFIPQFERVSAEEEPLDFRNFTRNIPGMLGSQIGLPNYYQGTEQRLNRNLGETSSTSQLIGNMMKKDPEGARKLIQSEPDSALEWTYHPIFSDMRKMLTALDETKNLTSQDRQARLDYLMQQIEEVNNKYDADIEKARQGKNKERAQKAERLPESLATPASAGKM